MKNYYNIIFLIKDNSYTDSYQSNFYDKEFYNSYNITHLWYHKQIFSNQLYIFNTWRLIVGITNIKKKFYVIKYLHYNSTYVLIPWNIVTSIIWLDYRPWWLSNHLGLVDWWWVIDFWGCLIIIGRIVVQKFQPCRNYHTLDVFNVSK